MEGYRYTWARRIGKPNVVEEKLDQALATPEWIDMFPSFKLINVVTSKSDHSLIILRLNDVAKFILRKDFILKTLGSLNWN